MTLNDNEINEINQQFLLLLYQQANGDPAVQVSMYDIGEALGLDRSSSCRVAEELIALQLVDIRTLSGGIGISADGVEKIRAAFGDNSAAGDIIDQLGSERILDPSCSQAVVQVLDQLKAQAGNLGLAFEKLGELMADLETVDAQLGSPRPKTVIVKECLRSIKETVEGRAQGSSLAKINRLLGE